MDNKDDKKLKTSDGREVKDFDIEKLTINGEKIKDPNLGFKLDGKGNRIEVNITVKTKN